MAAFDTSRTAYGSASAVNGFFALISRAYGAVIAWNDARVTRRALAALTDRELEDIGLIRGDIDTVATPEFFR